MDKWRSLKEILEIMLEHYVKRFREGEETAKYYIDAIASVKVNIANIEKAERILNETKRRNSQ